MNRRDFLSFRLTKQGKVLELSCRTLYMRCLDAQAGASTGHDAVLVDYEPWMGEPPAMLVKPSAEALLGQIEADLQQVTRLRLLESEWLGSTGLGEQLAPLLAAFRSRGGRVEVANTTS